MAVTETFFRQFGQPRAVPRYQEITGSCRWQIEGAGSWLLDLHQGSLTVSRDRKKPADCTIVCSESDFDQLIHRQQNPFTAYLQGRITVAGNLSLAQVVMRLLLTSANPLAQQEPGKGGRHE